MKSFLGVLALWATAMPSLVSANPPDNVKSEALQNAVILVIRHGEKPDKGIHLSPAGKARATAYANYFKNYKVDGQPLKLDALFAAADSNASHRPRLTLEPTAKALDLNIDSHYEDMHFKKLADKLRKSRMARRSSSAGITGRSRICSRLSARTSGR